MPGQPPTPQSAGKSAQSSKVTENWEKILYTRDRINAWIKGELTLRELHGISGPEMLEMAVSGFAMYEQGRYNEAKVIFEGLAALDPRESYYRTALGAIYLAQDKIDDALREFDEAIRLNPKDLAAYVNRGEVRLRRSQVVEAASDFKRAVDLDPQNKDPLTLRARALAAATLETIQRAQEGGKGAPSRPATRSGEHKKVAAKKPDTKKGKKR